MLSVTDAQLRALMTAASAIAPKRRSVFLERVAAMLPLRGRFDDRDLSEVADLALRGLIRQQHEPAA